MPDIISPDYSNGGAGSESDDNGKLPDIFGTDKTERSKDERKQCGSIAFVRLLIFHSSIVDPNSGEVENFTKQGMGGRNNQATSLGTISVGVEQKSEVIKTSDHSRQAKKRDKRSNN